MRSSRYRSSTSRSGRRRTRSARRRILKQTTQHVREGSSARSPRTGLVHVTFEPRAAERFGPLVRGEIAAREATHVGAETLEGVLVAAFAPEERVPCDDGISLARRQKCSVREETDRADRAETASRGVTRMADQAV